MLCETSVAKATPLLTLAGCNRSYIRFLATVTKQLSPHSPTPFSPPQRDSDSIEKEGKWVETVEGKERERMPEVQIMRYEQEAVCQALLAQADAFSRPYCCVTLAARA
ncbi:hypothetical protein DNTS_023095 [Danionella cerebrum]|uniref:Uncharacterized protein n=1 Tax=Danionella cerebrum TaxID=2873325 RepID=A0A553QSM2_9TELE|nr:hypothetical protein DNTS_023095 [Danionella translucida]